MHSPCVLAIPLALGLLPPEAAAQAPGEQLAQVAAAYAAKITASAIFISGRTLESVMAQELAPTRPIEALIRPLLQFDIDRTAKTVTCRIQDAKATAGMHALLGCSLITSEDAPSDALHRFTIPPKPSDPRRPSPDESHWPYTEEVREESATGVRRELLEQAIDRAFAERHRQKPVHTRAIVVIHKGRLVAERYAEGFHKDMPLPGWSMTKTLTNALIGMRVGDGELDLDARVAGGRKQDGVATPTIANLLTMTAGRQWNEDYDDPQSDALRMLFRSADHAEVYREQPQAAAPGQEFVYASGATNLLCKLLRASFADDQAYWSYPTRLFAQLRMQTAVLEVDPSGTFVGSSYGYASARDWARLGLLFQQDGVFLGQRILPPGWVQQSTQATPASDGRFGRHIWLNAEPAADGDGGRKWPDLPADLFSMDGHEGQYCVVSPRAELVIVRLGCTKNGGFDLHGMVRDIHTAAAAR